MPKRNIVWIIIGVVIAVLLWKVPESYIRRDTLYNKFSPLIDVRVQVLKNYVEPIEDDELLRGAIDGMLNRLDPYSIYFTESEYEQFNKQNKGEFFGIGVQVATPSGGGLIVVSPIEGSPAFQAGLRSGDRITHVDGVETMGKALDKCVEMISGKPGTQVTLTILRLGIEEPIEQRITRGLVSVRTVRGWARTNDWNWDYVIDPRYSIGYIRILGFEGNTGQQFDAIVKDLLTHQNIRGLILDVRDNPGGMLEVVVTMANRFLTTGTIVSTKGRQTAEVPYLATAEDTYPDIPAVVLVNGGSASASEILAGALSDHGRAVVVGEKTFGKGSVQEILQVENFHGKIKLTTAYYYLPKGERIHGKGIVPDRIIDLTSEERTAMLDSWRAVYSADQMPATTQPTTSTAPAEDSSETRFEILIDRQLQEAIDVVREQIEEQTDHIREASVPADHG